jgi:hypothetical protein
VRFLYSGAHSDETEKKDRQTGNEEQKLTNTYGMLSNPGDSPQVGLGRVESGTVRLEIKRLDAHMIEGEIATVKPLKLSFISYAFNLSFRAELGKKPEKTGP